MSLPLDFLASLCEVSIEEIMTRTKKGSSEGGQRSFVELRNELKPLELFCYFGARFGPPNGIQNLLRNDHSDNLVHWDWTLKYQESLIFFWGTNFRTDVMTIGEIKFTDSDKVELVSLIQSDFKNFGPQMSEVRKKLEHWTEFVNPYWRLTRAISSLQEELARLNLISEFSDGFNTPHTAAKDSERWNAISSSYSKAFGLCFGIRSMLPVKAEAFVNLLVFIQARPDIKTDPRLMDSIFRQQIDIRVKSLHINCLGFEKAVDYTNPACKRFHTLVNERNDLLHGNVVPEKQKFNEVYFLGNVPVFKEYRSLWDRTLAVDSKAVGLERLENEIATVNEFVEYVISCLKPEVGAVILSVISKRDLGKNSEDGRFGLLFPDHLVDSRPLFDKGSE